jgi:hypothetical protein
MPACRALQSDLFTRPGGVVSPEAEVWRVLPERARRSLTDLLARLLLAHAAGTSGSGGRHDR